MDPLTIQTKSLVLRLLTKEQTLAMVEAMSPEDRAEVSPDWLAQLHASDSTDPWKYGFSMVHRDSSNEVGQCGFKGPPSSEGEVEIAYGLAPEYQGKGYATEAAAALTVFAFTNDPVRIVCAHTLPAKNASTSVLTKCGFQFIGEVDHPEDGLVWRWEKTRPAPGVSPSTD